MASVKIQSKGAQVPVAKCLPLEVLFRCTEWVPRSIPAIDFFSVVHSNFQTNSKAALRSRCCSFLGLMEVSPCLWNPSWPNLTFYEVKCMLKPFFLQVKVDKWPKEVQKCDVFMFGAAYFYPIQTNITNILFQDCHGIFGCLFIWNSYFKQ